MPTEDMYTGLQMAIVCKELGILPDPGGYFDQDCIHMRYLQAGLQAINRYEAAEAKKKNS